MDSGSAVKINGDVAITGEVKDTLKAENTEIEKDLTVGGTTTFNGKVEFNKSYGVTIPDLTVTKELNIKGKVTGLTSTTDLVETDQIKVKTAGKSIDVADPLRNLEAVVRYGQVKWDKKKGVFYLLKDYKIESDDEDLTIWTEFTQLDDDTVEGNIKSFFGWSNTTERYTGFAFYRMTNCQHLYSDGHPVDKDESKGGFGCRIITPLTEYLFYDDDKDKSLNEYQLFFKYVYKKYMEDKTVTHIRDTIYNQCMNDKELLCAFMDMASYLLSQGYPIYGIKSIENSVTGNELEWTKKHQHSLQQKLNTTLYR